MDILISDIAKYKPRKKKNEFQSKDKIKLQHAQYAHLPSIDPLRRLKIHLWCPWNKLFCS